MKKMFILFLGIILFLSGCILEYREGLPAKIVITEIPDQEPESIFCENPPCATLVQLTQVKRTEYVCSPSYKGANDDPQGVIYKTELGDACIPLEKPTTVCLKYDCDFNEEENIGYYEIEVKYSGEYYIPDKVKYDRPYNYSTGVALLNETPMKYIGRTYKKGSIGEYKNSGDVLYTFTSNLLNGNFETMEEIGYYYDGEFNKKNPKLVDVQSKNCLASMPIKYPYNSIDFSYNPIINITENPSQILQNLKRDYTYIDDSDYFFDPETSSKEDPCDSICNSVDDSLLGDGTSTSSTSKQYEEDCNKCQEEQRAKKKEEMKQSKISGAGLGGYSYSELTVNEDTGEALCTGMNPCVEIDRALAAGTKDEKGKTETKYYVCQCACEVVTYASYGCTRAGDASEYFYTSCEKNDITSDQGGYFFSIHGFEAELFKNILGNSENKMPTFMVGQGSTFSDYFATKEKCVPEITADVTIVAGMEPFTPKEMEVIEGSPICFRNDGTKERSIYKGSEFLLSLNSTDSICLATGKDTNFTKGKYNIYVDSNEIYATLNVLSPSTTIAHNSIKENENGELKFFYNDVELSLLYASTPFSNPLSYMDNVKFNSLDTGEFFIPTGEPNEEILNTWISYSLDTNNITLSQSSVSYNSKYDLNKDGYVDILDLLSCSEYEVMSGIQICSEMKNAYSYFKNLALGTTDFDYPIIKKNTNSYDFSPNAIILPLYSDFCIHNTINKKVDLVLEKKTNPAHSRGYDGVGFFNSGMINSPTNVVVSISHMGDYLRSFIRVDSESPSFMTFINSLQNTNANYQFVEGKALYQGLECCFHLGEPGVYRVSSITGETDAGYVVVLPTDVSNTIVLKDYEYSPEYAVPKEGDFVCISNPYPFDRTLLLSGSTSGTLDLGASTETCSYDWANKKGNNIQFKDNTTGAEFQIEVTNSSILNIEILNSFFVQKTGKISKDGTVCFINKNEMVSNVSIYSLQKSGVTLSKNFILDGNSMNCFSNYAAGLYKVTISPTEDTLVMPNTNNYYLVIAEDNEGYIYNSSFYGSPLNIQLEDLESLISSEITSKKQRNVIINNLDIFEYHLYTKISFDNRMGLLSSSYYIQTPEILFENTGNESITVKVYNTNDLKSKFHVIANNSYQIHDYSEGDYQIEISGNFYPLNADLDIGYNTLLKTALLNSDRMLIQKGDTYYVDNSPKTFEYAPIIIKNKLNFSVSSSTTQSVNFGIGSTNSKISVVNSGGLNTIINLKVVDNPISGSFVIDSVINKKDMIEMQKLSGTVSNLDFGVQLLNDVPSSDILLQAKQMLAYDQSLPIFMYSRLGDVEVGVENPSTTEVIKLPKGTIVSYIKSDWVSELSKNPPYIPANALVTSTENVEYGPFGENILQKDINFTIETLFSGVKKTIQVKAIEPSKTIVMNYTEFKIDDDGKTGNKTYIINNLAYEPRAFNLKPSNIENYCIEFNGNENKNVVLTSSINKTASSMMLYNVRASVGEDLNNIKFHDGLYDANTINEVSTITILPNYGVSVSSINLKRLDAGDETGYLYLAPEITINAGANIEKDTVNFNEGFISGLNETLYVRAYRFYGNAAQLTLKVDPTVYDITSYSVLSRVFPSENVPAIEKLLGVTNLYLRRNDVKAVPNKWYMAGLANTDFSNLIKGSDIYLTDIGITPIATGDGKGQWVNTGCGNYVFVVPFNNTHYSQVFAYDVPVSGTSSTEFKKNANYSYTTQMNYPYAIQKVNSTVSIVLYNGEIINDVRILMSENPNEATEICGYYDTTKEFGVTNNFGGDYGTLDKYVLDFHEDKSEYGIIGNPCLEKEKHDFELDVDSESLRNSIYNALKLSGIYYGNVMLYTPTGTFCGWGGISGIYNTIIESNGFCDGTQDVDLTGSDTGKVCAGNIGSCSKNSKIDSCLDFYVKDNTYWESNYNSILNDYCVYNNLNCINSCTGSEAYVTACKSKCNDESPKCYLYSLTTTIEQNFKSCYDALGEYEDDFESGTSISGLNTIIIDNCSSNKISPALNYYISLEKDTFFKCLEIQNSDEDFVSCGDAAYWNSVDNDEDKYWDMKTWWCRSNIDAFGYETQMFCSGEDCWNIMEVSKLSVPIKIENQFDNGVSYNNNPYDFISGGYFDIYDINSGTQNGAKENSLICTDRGKKKDGDDHLSSFYSDTNLSYDKGLSEDASTFGLFFMLNSVDTGDYFFKNEISEDYVEKSNGYALSSSFNVQNTKGRKYLCVGKETFNGQDVILGPGGKENVVLDLNASYQIYEPAYFTNLKMDDGRTFSHVSLFAHTPLSDYSLGNFTYLKPLTSGGYIEPKPDYNSIVNIYLYNLTTHLKNDDGSLSSFDVINLIKGETLTLQNTGDSEITWFYGLDDICEQGFTNVLNERYSVECGSSDNYKDCINNPTKYSVNPSDITKYLENKIEKVIVPKGSEIKIDASTLSFDGVSGEYLFFNPETGKRFKVIISNEKYVVDININTFTQDSVNVFKNTNSRLCIRNYDFLSKDLILISKSNPSTKKTISIPSYDKYCLTYEELTSFHITDSILGRQLELYLEDFSSSEGNEKVVDILTSITQKVTENDISSYNPAYGFLELNPGASATPAVITTEIVDYTSIIKSMSCTPTLLNPCFGDGDVSGSIAKQIYAIVSNSIIKETTLCEGTKNIGTLPDGTLCGSGEEEVEDAKTTREIFDVSKIDCDEKVTIDGKLVYKLETAEERNRCKTTKTQVADKIKEIENELNPFTIINEEKVITMLPILIKFDKGKTSLTESEVKNIKDFIDSVNQKVYNLCDTFGNCENKNKINDNCDDAYGIEDRYLDMIGFIILIDDAGSEESGNCSLMYNYLDGVMNVSIHAATTTVSEDGDILKMGTPSMIVGLGINRKENAIESCWTDLEFKKEIESLFNSDFTILLDKGIIGVGHYCLRDGECLPFSTGAKNGEDYGLYMPLNKDTGWGSFKPLEISPIDPPTFAGLSTSEKEHCVLINGLYYCDPTIDLGIITSSGNSNLGLNSGLLGSSGLSSSFISTLTSSSSAGLIGNNNVGGLLGSTFSGIQLNTGISLINPPLIVFPGLLNDGVKKEPYGKEWLDRCGRYYYNGEGMTMVVYPELEVAQGQQGKSCNPGRMMEIYKKFNC